MVVRVREEVGRVGGGGGEEVVRVGEKLGGGGGEGRGEARGRRW